MSDELKWRGVPLSQVPEDELVLAWKQACQITGAIVQELARRGALQKMTKKGLG